MKPHIKKILLEVLDYLINFVVIFAIVFGVQAWIIAPFDIFGPSMCDTLNNLKNTCQSGYGEKILLNEFFYKRGDPKRGDIVVFKSPSDNTKYFIKRVIGLPGETIDIKNGEVYLTKKDEKISHKIDESYLNEINKGKTKTYFSNFAHFEVPEDKYFVMGDNRIASTDSRSCFEGTLSLKCQENPESAYIDKENIRGKAMLVWWPIKTAKLLKNPIY